MPDIYDIYRSVHFWAALVYFGKVGKSFYYRLAVLLQNLNRWGL